jgi:hypothetical protein
MKTQIARKTRGRPPLPADLADIMSLVDKKDTPVSSRVRKDSAPKNTFTRSRWTVEASPEDFQDTEWGWDEYK